MAPDPKDVPRSVLAKDPKCTPLGSFAIIQGFKPVPVQSWEDCVQETVLQRHLHSSFGTTGADKGDCQLISESTDIPRYTSESYSDCRLISEGQDETNGSATGQDDLCHLHRYTEVDALTSNYQQTDTCSSQPCSLQHATCALWCAPSALCSLPTTLMIRNIPQQYTRDALSREWPNDGSYDYFYLPYKTYAFINFTSSAAALAFKERWHKMRLRSFMSRRALNISCAELQGLLPNLQQLKKNRPWRLRMQECQPFVYENGVQITLEDALARVDD